MDRLSSTALCVIAFAVIGPVLGTIATLMYINATSTTPLQLAQWFDSGMWWVYVVAIVVGYLLGTLPAALSGLAFGVILVKYRLGYFSSAVVGAVIGAFVLLIVTSIASKSLPDSGSLVIVLVLGTVSGSLCAIASSLVVTGSNN